MPASFFYRFSPFFRDVASFSSEESFITTGRFARRWPAAFILPLLTPPRPPFGFTMISAPLYCRLPGFRLLRYHSFAAQFSSPPFRRAAPRPLFISIFAAVFIAGCLVSVFIVIVFTLMLCHDAIRHAVAGMRTRTPPISRVDSRRHEGFSRQH